MRSPAPWNGHAPACGKASHDHPARQHADPHRAGLRLHEPISRSHLGRSCGTIHLEDRGFTEGGYDGPQETRCKCQPCVTLLLESVDAEGVDGQLAPGSQRDHGAIVHAQLQLGGPRHVDSIANIDWVTNPELPTLPTGLGKALVE